MKNNNKIALMTKWDAATRKVSNCLEKLVGLSQVGLDSDYNDQLGSELESESPFVGVPNHLSRGEIGSCRLSLILSIS